MSRFSHRLGACARGPAVGVALVLAGLGNVAAAPSQPAVAPRASAQACMDAQASVWPSSPIARRLQIARLQLVLRQCMDDAQFLAQLGGLLLENEDPTQAMIWLERSLLLDPGNLGAQADHAIALAELGEPEALRALAEAWRERTDIPLALRQRLFPADPSQQYALPNVRLGEVERPRWGLQAEISLVAGRESNLDRSPKLSELTLTVPEGPLVLPVISEPRSGNAGLVSAVLLGAHAVTERTILRSGLTLNARRAPSEPATDWQQSQWTVEAEHRGSGWRVQADTGIVWISGALNEPYRLQRLGLAAELMLNGCGLRASGSRDRRVQSLTEALDSSTRLWTLSLQCALPGFPRWLVSLNYSHGDDRPDSDERPGGAQALRAEGLRISGPVGPHTRLDFYVRDSRVADASGYNELLENNAVRRLKLRQHSLELIHSLNRFGWTGWSATLQWQSATQRSNLQLFGYRADTLYGGVRWAW